MLFKYPRPEKGDMRWYVYAHPKQDKQYAFRVKITSVASRDATYVVDKALFYKGLDRKIEVSKERYISYIKMLPDSLLEAKKLFIHLNFGGALM